LKKIDLAGGPPVTLCKSPGFQIGTSAWTPDGSTIIFGGRGQGALYRVSSGGGIAEPVTALDTEHGERFNALPTFLPDGKHFVYLRDGIPEVAGIYLGSLDTKPQDQRKNRRILQSTTAVPYVNGKLFFVRDGTLMAQTFDTDKLELAGDPFPIAEHIGGNNSTNMFSVSPAGTLAYRQIAGQQGTAQNRITAWYDRAGKQTSRLEVQNQDVQFRLSPDARSAVSVGVVNNLADGLWIDDFARGVRTRLTFQQPGAQGAVWSPDGTRVYYNLQNEIYQKAANGAGDAKKLLQVPGPRAATSSVSQDGRFLLYTFATPSSLADLGLLPLQGDPKPVTLLQTQANDVLGSFSPDGRWIAYYSNESNPSRYELYVRPFVADGPAIGDGKWQISHSGATTELAPHWTKNGHEILFRINDEFHAAAIGVSGSVLQPGQETTLFTLPVNSWDVTADGEKFLITTTPAATTTSQGPQAPITVVLNWEAEFNKK
jgi:eukaryotic-like serine/threonine-protein kinase